MQAERIWGRLYVSFLYYVLLLFFQNKIVPDLDRSWPDFKLIQKYPNLRAFILRIKEELLQGSYSTSIVSTLKIKLIRR